MESPKSTKAGLNYYSKTTPKASKKLYWPKNNESESPKMCGFAEKQEEFGWGDSPEPLKLDPKFITGHSKKKLDCVESPVSSHSRRPTKRRPALDRKSSPNAADNDLARILEINRRILSARPVENLPSNVDNNSSMSVTLCSTLCANSSRTAPESKMRSADFSLSPFDVDRPCVKESLDNVLQSFFQEEDDVLLSQVEFVPDVPETPSKSKFTKSLSDNQLDSPNRKPSSGFRRTASFQNSTSSSDSTQKDEPQPLKKQKSFHTVLPQTQTKCSLEEIEKKRLAAKYRREIKEIERRKLEAQKRLNERRARMASDMVKR